MNPKWIFLLGGDFISTMMVARLENRSRADAINAFLNFRFINPATKTYQVDPSKLHSERGSHKKLEN